MKNSFLFLVLIGTTQCLNAQNALPQKPTNVVQSAVALPTNSGVINQPTVPQKPQQSQDFMQAAERGRLEQEVAMKRMEQEKQVQMEMENYRTDIMLRLIRDEFYRISGNNQPLLPQSSPGVYSSLAKYKALKELALEQKGKKVLPPLPQNNNAPLPPNTALEFDRLIQQLDQRINDEEQRAEMESRYRLEAEERYRQQDRLKQQEKQLPLENKK